MPLVWLSAGEGMPLVWLSAGHGMPLVWLSAGDGMPLVWPSAGHWMPLVWPSAGDGMPLGSREYLKCVSRVVLNSRLLLEGNTRLNHPFIVTTWFLWENAGPKLFSTQFQVNPLCYLYLHLLHLQNSDIHGRCPYWKACVSTKRHGIVLAIPAFLSSPAVLKGTKGRGPRLLMTLFLENDKRRSSNWRAHAIFVVSIYHSGAIDGLIVHVHGLRLPCWEWNMAQADNAYSSMRIGRAIKRVCMYMYREEIIRKVRIQGEVWRSGGLEVWRSGIWTPFGPRCRPFNIGPKAGPHSACRPKLDPPPFQCPTSALVSAYSVKYMLYVEFCTFPYKLCAPIQVMYSIHI